MNTAKKPVPTSNVVLMLKRDDQLNARIPEQLTQQLGTERVAFNKAGGFDLNFNDYLILKLAGPALEPEKK